MNKPFPSVNQQIPIDSKFDISLHMKREDLIDAEISGNKYRKLLYNIKAAKSSNQTTLLTFGGAFSNHIAAVAACGSRFGFNTIGIIRGEEVKAFEDSNPTLQFAKKQNMILHYISRSDYKRKNKDEYIQYLRQQFGSFYLLPEGGTNELAVKGCEEILHANDREFDIICCPIGTGGTISGIINSSVSSQKIIGYSAVKDHELKEVICKFAHAENWKIEPSDYGGYGKIDKSLIDFINHFKSTYNIPLDPIYNGKMMYRLFEQIENREFPKGTKILAVHTGGLQGLKGMNWRIKQTQLPRLL